MPEQLGEREGRGEELEGEVEFTGGEGGEFAAHVEEVKEACFGGAFEKESGDRARGVGVVHASEEP